MHTKIQIFKFSDFLAWQRGGELILSPSFQRRPVWSPAAKSYLVDSIARGMPVPPIFVRERLDLSTQKTVREVVDGQQRLRTLIAFVDKASLPDASERDNFRVLRKHNPEIARHEFGDLASRVKSQILGYEFGTYILPPDTEDREVLGIFARLNSTGVKVNGQELRNAEYFGSLKQLMYQLAHEQLDRWRRWSLFSEDEIARMKEVEFVSDVTLTIEQAAITGKTQGRLNNLYERYDDSFPGAEELTRRFRKTMDVLEKEVGERLDGTVFRSDVLFYSLWVLTYDLLYGIDAPLDQKMKPRPLPSDSFREAVRIGSERIRSEDVNDDVLDAIRRASSDTARRVVRHEFLRSVYRSV